MKQTRVNSAAKPKTSKPTSIYFLALAMFI